MAMFVAFCSKNSRDDAESCARYSRLPAPQGGSQDKHRLPSGGPGLEDWAGPEVHFVNIRVPLISTHPAGVFEYLGRDYRDVHGRKLSSPFANAAGWVDGRQPMGPGLGIELRKPVHETKCRS
jgi:hypothetical protein